MAGIEAQIERKVCLEALALGVRNLKLSVVMQAGWPDRMFLIPGGKPFFIEFKRPGGQLREMQVYVHGVMVKLGYDVEVHDDVERALTAIQVRLTGVKNG